MENRKKELHLALAIEKFTEQFGEEPTPTHIELLKTLIK